MTLTIWRRELACTAESRQEFQGSTGGVCARSGMLLWPESGAARPVGQKLHIWYCKPGAAPKHALPPAAPHHGKGACSPHGAPPQRRRWHKEWAACRTFSLLRRRRLLARERGASFSLAVGKASSAKKVVGGGEDSQGRMFEDGGGICGRLTAPPRSCSRSATPPATSAAPSTTRTCRRCSLNILPAESCPPPVTLFAEDAFSTAKENKPHRSRAKKRRRLSTKDVRRAVCCLRRAFR